MFDRRDLLKIGILSCIFSVKIKPENTCDELVNKIMLKINKFDKNNLIEYGIYLDPHLYRHRKVGFYGYIEFYNEKRTVFGKEWNVGKLKSETGFDKIEDIILELDSKLIRRFKLEGYTNA